MKSLLLDVENCEVAVIELDERPELDFFYEKLNCDVIDIVERRIKGEYFQIVCDDEGALKTFPIISAVDGNMEPALCGNLMFFNSVDDNGELVGLKDEDIELIKSSIHDLLPIYSFENGLAHYNPVLVGCEYY